MQSAHHDADLPPWAVESQEGQSPPHGRRTQTIAKTRAKAKKGKKEAKRSQMYKGNATESSTFKLGAGTGG
jgi:hypothetical protein